MAENNTMIEIIDKIDGQVIKGVEILTWDDRSSLVMIEKVLLEFDDCNFLIELDPDSDEIILNVFDDFKLTQIEQEHKIIDSNSVNDFGIESLIGKKIIWIWTMTNNQGYFDALQIEIDNYDTYQFLIIASQIEIRKVLKIKSPTTNK